jgi:calcyphosin
MPKRRILIIKEAFSKLDTSHDGRVTMDEIERLYDPSHHPEVLAGRLRPRDALLELLRVFEDPTTRDGVLTWHEFLAYYKDLSAGIEDDDTFELMIRNAWHISGGRGWCANSSNRRVLVTFRDGTQRVVEIENDLGIHAKDKRRMIQQLTQAQGLRGVVDISLAN